MGMLRAPGADSQWMVGHGWARVPVVDAHHGVASFRELRGMLSLRTGMGCADTYCQTSQKASGHNGGFGTGSAHACRV